MSEVQEQPTPEQEAANAAYLYRKHVQSQLIERFREPSIKLNDAEWWWIRFKTAYETEIRLGNEAK